ncbi:Alpha-1,2-mannosidase, putative [Hondaea fermentalgiana]|uniref:Alpha-1,2-mannosidase, putative n=1 Tax=Hondaea fermentalgiana TaxID=2315210 RepID=A0A2R5G6M4_9STRA|nr:Alpha-1,2-mannosidase, putative [Hondaea fermentalgiana]|eukprot:GBG25979.1 Alpha-1,2-mannosidase, putative [Hondaea fermentalgiana]
MAWVFGGWMLLSNIGCENRCDQDDTFLRAEADTKAIREMAMVSARAMVEVELSEATKTVARLEAERDKALADAAKARRAADATLLSAKASEAKLRTERDEALARATNAERLAAARSSQTSDAVPDVSTPKPRLRHGSSSGRSEVVAAGSQVSSTKFDTLESGTLSTTQLSAQQAGWQAHKTALGKSPVEVVDILRGTDNKSWRSNSRGNALPLVSRPFGMTHWALTNTINGREAWFFNPYKQSFAGIRCTHQPSPWIGDYGFFDVRPMWQRAPYKDGSKPRTYDRQGAIMLPHYMSVKVTSDCVGQDCVSVELAVTERAAIFRFGYPSGGEAPGIDFKYLSNLRPADAGPEKRSAGNEGNVVRFTAYSTEHSVFDAPALMKHHVYAEIVAEDKTLDMKLDTTTHRVSWNPVHGKRTKVLLRVGTSFISAKQARLNLGRELGASLGWDAVQFDRIREEGAARWNELLGRVQVTADSHDELVAAEETLYSCLYRGLLFPRPLTEVDENGKERHWSPYQPMHFFEGPISTDSGFWDAYRAQYPMLHLIYPDLVVDIMEGWVNALREDPNRMLTQWASPGRVGSMEGSMGEVSLAEGIVNGALSAKSQVDAMDYIKRSATDEHVPNGRNFLQEYDRFGFVPHDQHRGGTVSLSLNYYLSDGVGSIVAEARGDKVLAQRLKRRSKNWRNLWDPATKFFRPKRASGSFVDPFRSNEWMGPYTEGGPWQYRFYVPHDPKGLREAYENADPADKIHEMNEMLQHSFGEYAHNNQPVHHVLYMFAHAGCPLDGQRYIHHTLRTQYGDFGYAGDEDNGEMSSWFVLSSIGLYALVPGSGKYQVGAPPLYRTVTIDRPAVDKLGRAAGKLTIRREVEATTTPLRDFTPSTRGSWRGQKLTFDDDAVTIPYAELLAGGELVFGA